MITVTETNYLAKRPLDETRESEGDCIEEPAEEPAQEPVFEEPTFEEPTLEGSTFGEPVPDTLLPDTPIVEETVEGWAIPPEPFDAEGWPSAPLSLEDVPQAEDLPVATAPPAEASTESKPVQNYPETLSAEDMALYQDWASLGPKRRARRKARLRERGLPLPSKDGTISITVV